VLYEPAFIRFAVEAKVADILVGNPEGLPVADIAKKTGINQGKLARILRYLATKNCFREGMYQRDTCCILYFIRLMEDNLNNLILLLHQFVTMFSRTIVCRSLWYPQLLCPISSCKAQV
jgi:hypothetical protein